MVIQRQWVPDQKIFIPNHHPTALCYSRNIATGIYSQLNKRALIADCFVTFRKLSTFPAKNVDVHLIDIRYECMHLSVLWLSH